MPIFDCIIVGAGPSGSSAAYHLAKRGVNVLLLEKQVMPRYKPCGGGVFPGIADWFDFDFSPVVSTLAHGMTLTFLEHGDRKMPYPLSPALWMVHRETFDHFLVQQAERVGAVVVMGQAATGVERTAEGWRVSTDEGAFEGRFVLAADGSKGPMAGWLGFPERVALRAAAVELEAPVAATDGIAYIDLSVLQDGYAWNFPKANCYSIGCGVLARSKGPLRQVLSRYCEAFGVDAEAHQHFGHPLMMWDGPMDLNGDRCLIVGDAAAMTDPFSAEGIRPAIYSGIKAAEHVAEALAGAEDALARYTQVVQSEHGGNMAWAKRLAGWMYPFSKSYYPDTDDHKLSIQPADFVYSEHPYEELVMKAMSLD